MDKRYCKDCVCLIGEVDGEWICDDVGLPVGEVEECSEVDYQANGRWEEDKD